MKLKLYTEEQVRNRLNVFFLEPTTNKILESLTPIELPSDEEIKNKARERWGSFNVSRLVGFEEGAKWMKEQILNQNIPELRNADGTYGQWGTSGNNQNK